MKPFYIESVGILAPGLVGWPQARAVLAGETPYTPVPLPPLKPAKLAPDVRRRTTDHIRIAIEVATEATQSLGDQARDMATVFATSDSDGAITHDICLEVAKPDPQVSPTRFHNSVNNAPAGYWCMAIGSQAPSTSVAGHDGSAAVGLLEAASQLAVDIPRVLLVTHDAPLPEPLHHARPFHASFGAAFVLSTARTDASLARFELELTGEQRETPLQDIALEQLRQGNPAARTLSLLATLAGNGANLVHLPYLSGRGLAVRIESIT